MELRKFDTKKTIGASYDCGKKKKCNEDEYDKDDDPDDPFCKPPFLCVEKLKFPDWLEKIEGCKDYLPIVVKPCKGKGGTGHPCDGKPCCDDDEYVKMKAELNQICPQPALCIDRIKHPVNAEKDDEDCDDEVTAYKREERPLPYCDPCAHRKNKKKPKKQKHDEDDEDDYC